MPIYEFLCSDCNRRFDDLVPMGEGATPTCSSCGSQNVTKLLSVFAVGGTTPARGEGCCGGGCCGHGGS